MIGGVANFFHRHKKGAITGIVIFVGVFFIGAYAIWSMFAWSSYSTHYRTWQKTVQSSLDNALQKGVGNDRLNALKKVASELANGSTICRVAPLIAWQSGVLPTLRSQMSSCQQTSTRIATLQMHVNKLVKYLENEQQFIGIISASALRKAEVTESDLATQVTLWQSVADATKNMAVDTEFIPVKEGATKRLSEVAEAWKGLLSAHEAKDKAKYTEAASHLSATYQTIADINTINDKQYQELLGGFWGVYRDTFKV